MGWETFSNAFVLIAVAFIVLYAIFTIIFQAQSNITFWMTRGSEKAAMNVVGRVTALGGTTGRITTTYRTERGINEYYLINSGKITCVITKLVQASPGVRGGEMTTINCYSAPIQSTINQRRMNEHLEIEFEKYYDNDLIVKEV